MNTPSHHEIIRELRAAKRKIRRDPSSTAHLDLTLAREAAVGMLTAGQLDEPSAALLRVALREYT
jgi:hypothetical protein